MKAYMTLVALLGVVTSTFAVAVAAPAESTPEPTYDWVVLESGYNTPVTPYANETAVVEARDNPQAIMCYNKGRAVQRAALTSSIDHFCNTKAIGRTLSSGQNLWTRYLDNFSGITVLVFMEMTNGCTWTVDSACNNNLRQPVDKCNTGGENGKQGGEMWDLCAHYRIDPGDRNSNDY
ncbi:hypothetical protein JR316_0010233 [Psilocybe cubensis]|uniref:Secreted protein n=2 Tax=Psilocybe cubensis TaxID=181762 RepID=A0A8H7XSQ3_PSICU|nr:hypothetical protein JR316_0010233 [Psilocybe cubensis]KAH9478000.1 hypothetical protein JR316_0010233 [Psilocybe cubensis]